MGARYLTDLLETMGGYVDGVKYAGGSFALMPRQRVQELNDLAHRYNAYVSTGGWAEQVLAHGSPDNVVAQIIGELGLDAVMFEAADPAVFEWYIKNYGAEVNLFVDHSQIVQLECLRAGIWGTKSTWGRITTFKP
jgi:phosphosulfolactate synthase (CoM biosynthesis protein A)